MTKSDFIAVLRQIMDAGKPTSTQANIVKNHNLIRIKGQLFSLSLFNKELTICPMSGGMIERIDLKQLASEEVTLLGSEAVMADEFGYVILEHSLVAQGYYNPQYRRNGSIMPFFTLPECQRIISIYINQWGQDVYTFNREVNGYLIIDLKHQPNREYFIEDTLLEVDDGAPLRVNSLVENWCWAYPLISRYNDINQAIAEGRYHSTLGKLV